MLAAQGYQESRLDHTARSKAGAVGIMQVLPLTAKDPNVATFPRPRRTSTPRKYMRFVMDPYFPAAEDGPRPDYVRVRVGSAPRRSSLWLDENVWFRERRWVAEKRIGRETVTYVSNIYKYAIAYQLALQSVQERDQAEVAVKN